MACCLRASFGTAACCQIFEATRALRVMRAVVLLVRPSPAAEATPPGRPPYAKAVPEKPQRRSTRCFCKVSGAARHGWGRGRPGTDSWLGHVTMRTGCARRRKKLPPQNDVKASAHGHFEKAGKARIAGLQDSKPPKAVFSSPPRM